MVADCRLDEVENRIIGQLSQGFRQRVGLAEALLHDPAILILDEPTSGLDPIQILEVRELIRELGERHTILLSTHILPEVEAVCGRVIIIARGKIAVDERLDDLRRDNAIVVEARGPSDAVRAALQTIPGVDRVVSEGQDGPYAALRVHTRDGSDLREAVGQKLASGGWPLRRLDLRRSSLEERFIQAVNREALADAQREAVLIMRHINELLKRELAAYFLAPMAYLVLLAFQLVAFLNFWEMVDALSDPRRTQAEFSSLNDPMTTYVAGSPAFWIAILVAVPALTMRLLAEERRSGTIETLLTLPVTEAQVVVAKWLAGVVMYLVLLLPFALYLPFLYYQAHFYFDLGPVLALGIGLTTVGMMFVALGLFFSSLTRNQIVAAIWTFVALFALIVLVPLVLLYAARQRPGWAEVVQFTSILHQVRSFAVGRLDVRHLALHLSAVTLLLSLTVKVMSGRGNR